MFGRIVAHSDRSSLRRWVIPSSSRLVAVSRHCSPFVGMVSGNVDQEDRRCAECNYLYLSVRCPSSASLDGGLCQAVDTARSYGLQRAGGSTRRFESAGLEFRGKHLLCGR